MSSVRSSSSLRRAPPSKDFCNSFWGDSGVSVLFGRMRGSAKTTDDLRNFWRQRSIIEEEYSNALRELAKMSIGKDETGDVRNAVDTLKLETEKIAAAHAQLASQVRVEMEDPVTAMLNKQIEHRRTVQAPLEKKFKTKQTQESYVAKAREKYQGDCIRIQSYTQQLEVNPTRDVERIQKKLQMAQQTVQANERDYEAFVKDVTEMAPVWENEWKNFCDSCQDLEEERVEFMKDNLWTYANAVSTVCVTDDLSCEAIRTILDQLEPERDVENFLLEYGTGNTIPDPPEFVRFNGSNVDLRPATSPGVHVARFVRNSRRQHPAQPTQPSPPPPQQQPHQPQHIPPPPAQPAPTPPQQRAPAPPEIPPQVNGDNIRNNLPRRSNAPSRTQSVRRVSVPLPVQPTHQQTRPPSPPPLPQEFEPVLGTGQDGSRILFYVKALYDYTATIDEEFDFQAGDVIAVTATPDDGWWSGELLDEERREEGRHIFPSNFVCLF